MIYRRIIKYPLTVGSKLFSWRQFNIFVVVQLRCSITLIVIASKLFLDIGEDVALSVDVGSHGLNLEPSMMRG
jgi:hypothetical protein